jgi:hypothetical protein
VATTTLNYPVSVLGRPVAIYAQGNGTDNITGQSTRVTDAAIIVFPGIADASISISPNPIPGNLTIPVYACIVDLAQNPISGVHFDFNFQGLGIGSATLDGISTAGTVPDATGSDGCVATTVTTNGIDSSAEATLTFSYGNATETAPITVSGNLILLALPSSLGGGGGTVTLRLLTGNGAPVPGVQLVGSCSGDSSIGILTGPGVTDAKGETKVSITANLNTVNETPKSGSCTFTTSTGSPSATVTLQGFDQCKTNPDFSPQCPMTTGSVSN